MYPADSFSQSSRRVPMKSFVASLLVCMLVVLTGCGKKNAEQKLEESAKKMEEAGKEIASGAEGGAEKMADAMKKMTEAFNDGKKVEPVNFRDLKALLPASLSGFTRGEASGERNAAMGMNVAEAHTEFTTEDGKSIRIKITDFGSMSGAIKMAAFAWTMADIDRESGNEYERTSTYNGHKAFERYNSADRRGEITVLIAGRFAVEVEGNDVDMSEIKGALSKVDVAKLASMKDVGVSG
jgi:hypothetical protein